VSAPHNGNASARIADHRPAAAAHQQLQAAADSSGRATQLKALQQVATGGSGIVQKTAWQWIKGAWVAQVKDEGEADTPAPGRDGEYETEYVDTGAEQVAEEEDDVAPPDPYTGQQDVGGTTIDFDALNSEMSGVQIGTRVAATVWRAMRQNLSAAITLPNKSHPAHGGNFNSPQRPESQIKDWANVISGDVKTKLTAYFKDKWQIDLE
jgi:hypothetical protein